MPALMHMADAVEQVLVLRTFLGPEEEISARPSKVPHYVDTNKKFINQYSFKDVLCYLDKSGFKTRVYQDEYYSGMPQLIEDDVVRTFYIVWAERRTAE